MAQTTGRRRTTWRRSIPRNSPTCNGSGSSRRSSTTWCRSMTAESNVSIPTSPDGPQLIRGNSQLLFRACGSAKTACVNVKNKSHSVTADITVPESGAAGVIVTQGGSVGGWILYAHDGKLKYCYNFFGIQHYMITADSPIPAGKHQVRMEFEYDGGGLAKGGDVTLYYDGNAVGAGRVDHTEPDGLSPPTRPATSA